MSDLQKLLSLLFLKSAPQDLSFSSRLMMQLAAAYVFSGFIVLQTTLNPEDMFAGILLGFFVQYVFTYLVLQALGRRSRFLQTFCAILGVGILFTLFAMNIPLILLLQYYTRF